MTAENNALSLAPYHYRFIGFYVGLTLGGIAVLALLEYLLQTELDVGSGLAVGVIIGTAFGVITKFLTDHKRVPDAAERRRLIWAGIIISYAASALTMLAILVVIFRQDSLLALAYFLGYLDGSLAIVMLVVFGFLTAVLYGALYVIYGPVARRQLKAIERKAAPSGR